MRRTRFYGRQLFLLLIAFIVASCSLSTDDTPEPPTPLPTSTESLLPTVEPSPLPTLPPTELPVLPTTTAAPTPLLPALPATLEPVPLGVLVQQVDAVRLMTTVERLVSLPNRHALAMPAPDRGVHAARHILIGEFLAIQQAYPGRPIDVYAHEFYFTYGGRDYTGANLVMVIHGTEPSVGAVLVGAHYDTVSRDMTTHDNLQPGADDNGSGVAAVLEIARLVAPSPHRGTIICVLFGAEEHGRFGSKAFVENIIRQQGVDLRAMINLDMIGSPSDGNGGAHNRLRIYSAPPDSSPSRRLARLVEQVTLYYIPGLEVHVKSTLDRENRWGDHQSFSDAGYAAVRLVEPHDNLTRMHNGHDTAEHLDPAYLRLVTQAALATVLHLADSENMDF